MLPAMGMADHHRQEVYCGQCFEEFYGQEYCQNLRKDLEKLKDEFYDSDSARFWREWVVPTVNLLRRLSYMGFPLRNKDFIVVHLYNPVDSMAMGEMHFQVGRKAPGTLTLKFTKQNSSGAFVIQPKTLSNAEEMKLSMDPLAFLENLRAEMRDSGASVDVFNTMQVLVLMTDSCRLQRHCANAFFAKYRSERFGDRVIGREPTSMYHYSTSNSPISMNQWAPNVNSASFYPETSIRPSADGNYHPPWNFCVKNYVNYGAKTPASEVSIHSGQPFSHGHVRLNNQMPRRSSLTTRQLSNATCQSEPEESDETVKPLVTPCSTPPTSAADRMAELQRRMSDARLWDAPPKVRPTPPANTSPQSARSNTKVTEEYAGEANSNVPLTLPRSMSNETGRLAAPELTGSVRRHSEPKISQVEDYFVSDEQKSTKTSLNDRTSLTEEYAGEQNGGGNPEIHHNYPISPRLPRLEVNHGGSRTDMVDSYIGESVSSESSGGCRSRTSSLDAYVGEIANSRSLQSSPSTTKNLVPPPDMGQKSTSCEFLRPFVPVQQPNMTCAPHIHNAARTGQPMMDTTWAYRQPNMIRNEMDPKSVPDMSLLSQSTFPSWGSHRDYPAVNNTTPLIPLVVERINRGEYPSWDHLASSASSSISS